MKHIRLYETRTINSISNTINEYQKFLKDILPAVLEKYDKLVDDEEYYPDMGDKPSSYWTSSELFLNSVNKFGDSFDFQLFGYDSSGILDVTFFISFTEEELNDALLKLDAKKYNL